MMGNFVCYSYITVTGLKNGFNSKGEKGECIDTFFTCRFWILNGIYGQNVLNNNSICGISFVFCFLLRTLCCCCCWLFAGVENEEMKV